LGKLGLEETYIKKIIEYIVREYYTQLQMVDEKSKPDFIARIYDVINVNDCKNLISEDRLNKLINTGKPADHIKQKSLDIKTDYNKRGTIKALISSSGRSLESLTKLIKLFPQLKKEMEFHSADYELMFHLILTTDKRIREEEDRLILLGRFYDLNPEAVNEYLAKAEHNSQITKLIRELQEKKDYDYGYLEACFSLMKLKPKEYKKYSDIDPKPKKWKKVLNSLRNDFHGDHHNRQDYDILKRLRMLDELGVDVNEFSV
jgi:hypothetical protein